MVWTYSNGVDAWLDEAVFLVTSSQVDRVEVDIICLLFAELEHFDLWFVVLLYSHGSEVSDA
jgi:hypothetical protein